MKILALLTLASIGCGSGTTDPPNPLVGTWNATITDGTVTLIMQPTKAYNQVVATTDSTTSCQSTLSLNGTWTNTATTVSLTGKSGTYKAINCTDTTMNEDRAAMANELQVYSTSGATYTLSGNTLAITYNGTVLNFTKVGQ